MENKSQQINELALALSQVQGALEGAKKNKENPFFKSSYADLESAWDACRELLAKYKLAVTQTFDIDPLRVVIVTTLMHSSGQWIEGRLAMPLVKQDPQSCGSAISYGRRYALMAIVGLNQTDDDAETAMQRFPNAESIPNHAPTGDEIEIQACVTIDNKDLAKKAGFRWDPSRKGWFKKVNPNKTEDYPFEIEVIED